MEGLIKAEENHLPPKPAPKPGRVRVVRALYKYTAQYPDELSFQEGDLLYVFDEVTDPDWWKARCGNQTGLIPSNYEDHVTSIVKVEVEAKQKKGMKQAARSWRATYSPEMLVDIQQTTERYILEERTLHNHCLESQTEEVEQPLHEAARRGNLDFMRQCLQQGVSGTGLDSAGNTPLYWASHAGHIDCVRELLALPRPAVSAQNVLGDTPLHVAASRGHLEVVELLLSHGGDPQLHNKDHKTPLDLAVFSPIVNLLQMSMLGQQRKSIVTYDADEYAGDSD